MDLLLYQVEDDIFEILQTSHKRNLFSGKQFDQTLLEYCIYTFKQRTGIDV